MRSDVLFSRATVSTRQRMARARQVVVDNGLRWTSYELLLGVLRQATHGVYQRMVRLERRRGLGGRNSVNVNYLRWNSWDWSRNGEEWTPSDEWKQALVADVMWRYLRPQSTILEIGPGGGRFTEALLRKAGQLIVVDLSERCIELCRHRFAGAPNIEFHVNDGRRLAAVASESVDGVWSFDVFVHVAPPDAAAYLAEIRRVLRPGGCAVIHHPRVGREDDAANVGWRSTMTAAHFAELARAAGLGLQRQFDAWGPGGQFHVRRYHDVISVIEKPGRTSS